MTNNAQREVLLPCPFCGSKNLFIEGCTETFVWCEDCCIHVDELGGNADNRAPAIQKWNTRASTTPQGMGEEVEKALQQINHALRVATVKCQTTVTAEQTYMPAFKALDVLQAALQSTAKPVVGECGYWDCNSNCTISTTSEKE